MHAYPLIGQHQVAGHVGMDDSYKAVADRVGVHALEFRHGLEYQLIGQLGGLVQRRAGQYLGYGTA